MIISPEQLKAINEAMAMGNADTLSDVQTTFNDIKSQTNTDGPVQIDINNNVGGPAYTRPSAELAQKGVSTIPTNAGSLKITENTRKYSKRQVELGRMLEMRRTGKVYSKKRLNEMFMEDRNPEK